MRAPDAPTLPNGLDLDLAMLRVMYTSRGVSISGIDPRLNANRIARKLGVSRARVATRLRSWAQYGFLDRYDVWPNPYLFGLAGVSFDVRVSDRFAKDAVLARIGLVPGAVGGLDFLGDWFAVTFVLPRDADASRTAALLRGFTGIAEVGEAVPWASSASEGTLTPLELRIVRALRQYPTDSLASIARHVGVSPRTITSRYGRLIDEQAVWFVPAFDFRALAEPVVALNLRFRSGADRHEFDGALRRTYPRSLEFQRTEFEPALPETYGSYIVMERSVARTEELEVWVRQQPGVTDEEALIMKRVVSFPDTFDRLIASDPATTPGRRFGRAGARRA
jgi:DNA-binding Lrp family transcriptional regulator